MCTTTERGNIPATIIRNNLVFYGIREEAATSPEAAVRDVIKRFVTFVILIILVSAQRVPEADPLPGISFDTRPDPIQF